MNKVKEVLDKTREKLNKPDYTDAETYDLIKSLTQFKSGLFGKTGMSAKEFLEYIGYYDDFYKDYCNSGVPQAVLDAFNHVKEYYSAVNMVVFNKEGQWLFLDSDFDSPSFGKEIDTILLNRAVDEVYSSFGLPYVYQEP